MASGNSDGSGSSSLSPGGSSDGGSASSYSSSTPVDSKVQQIMTSVEQLKKIVDALTAKNSADARMLPLLASPIPDHSDIIDKNLCDVDRWVAKAEESHRINDVTGEINTYGMCAELEEKAAEYIRSADDLSKAMQELLKS